jgi:hypothetical protein
MRRDEEPPGGIDMEGAAMDAAGVDVLDRVRLAGQGVNPIDGERIFAADEDPPMARAAAAPDGNTSPAAGSG